jgi:hypothetical protein
LTENQRHTQRRSVDLDDSFPTLPVETLRDWYVTVCGGWSSDLRLDQIGINRHALETNTSLDPETDRVRVTILGHVRRPVLMDRFFEVVPLDEGHPNALRHSPIGEAVFPEGDDVLRRDGAPHPGDPVLLNNVVRRLSSLPDSEEFARILQEAFRREFPSEGTNS